MFIKDRMTPQPLVVVGLDTPVTEAQELMQKHNVRHLPVVTEGDVLAGLLTRETLLQVIPWSATSLSALETQYTLSKVKAGKVMMRDVITVSEEVPVEEAARVMVDNKINCLPVLREDVLVGIITDIDLLSTTMEMLGARQRGLRLSVTVPNRVGQMARLSTAIANIGGNLSAFGSWEVEEIEDRLGVVLKVKGVSIDRLVAAVKGLTEIELLDVREM